MILFSKHFDRFLMKLSFGFDVTKNSISESLSPAVFQTTLLVTRIIQHIALSCSVELKKKLDPKLPNKLDDKEVKKYIENNAPKVKNFAEKVVVRNRVATC
jgi:hypothetical protein